MTEKTEEDSGRPRLCGVCGRTDGTTYTSYPPQVKCTVDGRFHFLSDKCALEAESESEKPRLCEVLGVETGEWFTITYGSIKK